MKSDRQLQKDVMETLDFNPAIAAENIGVSVQDPAVDGAERCCFSLNLRQVFPAELICNAIRSPAGAVRSLRRRIPIAPVIDGD